jgi:hypothetical protein
MIKAMSSYDGSQPPQGGPYKSVYGNQQPQPIEGNNTGFTPYQPKPAAAKPKQSPGDVYGARRAWKQSGGQGDWRAYMPSQQQGLAGREFAPMPLPPQAGGPLQPGMGASQSAYQPQQSPVGDMGPALPYGSYQPPLPPAQPPGGFNASYGQLGGGYGSTPNFGQRDAFVSNINDTMAGYQANQGTYLGAGAPPPTWGQTPQFNFPAMWQQAGNMVQGGWKNPLLGLMG